MNFTYRWFQTGEVGAAGSRSQGLLGLSESDRVY